MEQEVIDKSKIQEYDKYPEQMNTVYAVMQFRGLFYPVLRGHDHEVHIKLNEKKYIMYGEITLSQAYVYFICHMDTHRVYWSFKAEENAHRDNAGEVNGMDDLGAYSLCSLKKFPEFLGHIADMTVKELDDLYAELVKAQKKDDRAQLVWDDDKEKFVIEHRETDEIERVYYDVEPVDPLEEWAKQKALQEEKLRKEQKPKKGKIKDKRNLAVLHLQYSRTPRQELDSYIEYQRAVKAEEEKEARRREKEEQQKAKRKAECEAKGVPYVDEQTERERIVAEMERKNKERQQKQEQQELSPLF